MKIRRPYPNELLHSTSPIVYKGKQYDKTAENYLKSAGSVEEQRDMSRIIDKINDVATKSMLRQASPDSIVAWCTTQLEKKRRAIADDAYVRQHPELVSGKLDKQPKRAPFTMTFYGLSEADLTRLMTYARKGLSYGRRPTYAEPDYQRAKIDAENDRYNRSYNTARMQTNANRRRKLTTGGRKDKA